MPKLVPALLRVYSELGARQCLCAFLSAQTSAKHSISKWGVWSKEKNTTVTGKARETALSKAISCHVEVPQVAAQSEKHPTHTIEFRACFNLND